MVNRQEILDHPFKRRRRRCNLTTAASLLVLFAVVSSVSAFVPLSLNHPTAPFQNVNSVLDALVFPKKRQDGRSYYRCSRLCASDDAKDAPSSSDGKSYRLSPEQLIRIKDSVDIVSVIESYGLPGFQRHGTNRAKAICPFHDDHNPSMSVDGQRGIYKCFACGAGGDVFNFVREYSALKKNEPMTFYQAVKHVAREFGDPSLSVDFDSSFSSRMSDEERKALNEKKQRLLLANAAAAAFYVKCLVTVPAAGAARSHLQERGLSATTVNTFALGYAPDGYFREEGKWGEGSLVEHLRSLGFTPSEMIEAGLATRTKGAQWKKSNEKKANNTASEEMNENDEDYSTLIDRFRNRLMVPIFDSRGANVLGFGARILAPEETDSSGYKAPKYINSPESLVFQKKNVLFGQHYASEAIRESQRAGSPGSDRGSVVIVEGYMDAILMCEAGIQEAVASMGTALTMEQLTNAARTAGTRGGRIILCFDGDEAGVNAIERLCTGSILTKIAETYVVEILIATLPNGVKDPGEYIDSKSSKTRSRAGSQFRKEVIDTAKDWTAWYLDRLLSRYDEAALRGKAGSFGDICDRISDFLSAFPNPAERTKRAHDVAGQLAAIVSGKSGSNESSNALRIQLETDLVNMVARKAGARESIERRIESVEGYSPDDINQKLSKMLRGDGVNRSDDSESLLSGKALKALKRADPPRSPESKRNASSRISSFDSVNGSSRYGRRGRARMRRSSKKIVPPPLTPHFSGFDFENLSDVDWLKLPREKWKRKKRDLTLGTSLDGEHFAKAKATRDGEDHVADLLLGDLVYFNSNEYHGQQYVTQDALDAGYSNGEVTRDLSIFEHGVGTLVRQDAHILVDAAEEKLLRNIINYSRARNAMVHSLATSDATGSRDRIEWSGPERAWLFERLVEQSNSIPKDVLQDGKADDLRLYLANLPDAPVGAFALDEAINPSSPLSTHGDPESTQNAISDAGTETAISISTSMDEANIPSDTDDIESWAASYDPTNFEDEADVIVEEQSVQQEALPPIESEPVSVEPESIVRCVDSSSSGCLDSLFIPEEDHFAITYDNSVSRELRAELEVQEAHASLLRAAALRQFAAVKSEWLTVGEVLASRMEQENATASGDQLAAAIEPESVSDGIIDLDSMSIDGLKARYTSVGSTLRDIAARVYQLDVSTRRICSRLLDYSNVDGIEGRISVALQKEIAAMVDEHLDSLPENWQAPANPSDGARFHNNRDPFQGWGDDMSLDRAESFERDIIQIDSDWGEWADDDFIWSPEEDFDSSKLSRGTGRSSTPNVLDNFDLEARLEENDESLEETLQRIDSEWAGWNDDVPVTESEASGWNDEDGGDSIFE